MTPPSGYTLFLNNLEINKNLTRPIGLDSKCDVVLNTGDKKTTSHPN